MIEVTITEVVLFAWAMLATGFAFKYQHAHWHAMCMIKQLLSDELLRDKVVDAWNKFNDDRTLGGAE